MVVQTHHWKLLFTCSVIANLLLIWRNLDVNQQFSAYFSDNHRTLSPQKKPQKTSNLHSQKISRVAPPISGIDMKSLWLKNKNVNSPGKYAAQKYLADCPIKLNRTLIFNTLKRWLEFSAQHNIYWFLTAGTLIGAVRHNDIIPYDYDIDLGFFSGDEAIIRKFETNRKEMSRKKLNLITRPSYHDSPRRMSCSGNIQSSMKDECSFTGPLARILPGGIHIDLFSFHVGHEAGSFNLTMYDEEKYLHYWLDEVVPLRQCQFMNLQVLCPNKPTAVLMKRYKDTKIMKPNYVCKNKNWVKI